MSREEIKKEIERLEEHNFMLNMGHWDLRTGEIIRDNNRRIAELKGRL